MNRTRPQDDTRNTTTPGPVDRGRGRGQQGTTTIFDGSTAIPEAWKKVSSGRQEAGPYAIQRVEHYYYTLTHTTDGMIRKYRTPEGARRAAKRHQQDKLNATLRFQAPQSETKCQDRENSTQYRTPQAPQRNSTPGLQRE